MTHSRAAAASSPEYHAALMAQIDYDSTTQGTRALRQALEDCPDPARRGLNARLVAGTAARRFRREQVAFMPPRPPKGDARRVAYGRLADRREDIARQLALAAAESDAWGAPTPPTAAVLAQYAAAAYESDVATRGDTVQAWAHPAVFVAAEDGTAPWVGGPTMAVEPGDVGVLALLGVDARWDAARGVVVVRGDDAPARRWGYIWEPAASDGKAVLTSAPSIARWGRGKDVE